MKVGSESALTQGAINICGKPQAAVLWNSTKAFKDPIFFLMMINYLIIYFNYIQRPYFFALQQT